MWSFDIAVTLAVAALALEVSSCSSESSSSDAGALPVILSFTAAPTSLPAGGGPFTLSWDVTGATEVIVNPSFGLVAPVGSQGTYTTASATVTLIAGNAVGTVTQLVTVTVAP